MQNYAAMIPKHDTNFEVLTKNLNATQDVVNQLPEEWKSVNDMDEISNQVDHSIQHWEDIKKRFFNICDQLERSIAAAEKGLKFL